MGTVGKIETRKSNFELLRIVLMLFVVAEHIIPAIGDIQTVGGGLEYYLGNLLISFFVIAVDCFVLISGYFGINLKINKLMKLEAEVLFYNISGLILVILTGIREINLKKDILLLVPTLTRKNWFVTIYFVLCLLSPILNWIIERLSKSQFRTIIGVMVVLFYVIPVFDYAVNAQTITMDSGYGIINFICLYFIGRYIKLYGKDTSKMYGLGYIASSLLLFSANYLLSRIFGFYFNTYTSYDSIFCLVGAVCLFLGFKNIKVQSKIINKIAAYSFAVYIFHTSPFYHEVVFGLATKFSANSDLFYILSIVIVPVLVYVATIIVEFVRGKLFGKLEDYVIGKIMKFKWMQSLKSKFAEFRVSEKSA